MIEFTEEQVLGIIATLEISVSFLKYKIGGGKCE